jgi:hypothetical protein
MIFLIIQIQIDIDINNDELLISYGSIYNMKENRHIMWITRTSGTESHK